MSGRMEGKVALITGGTRGIGLAMAHAFVQEGARVVVSSRRQESVEAAAEELNEARAGSAVGIACHTGKLDQIEALFERMDAEVGSANVLVNNAGTNPYFGPMLGVDWAAWDKTFEVNLKGYFEMSRQVVLRLMAKEEPGSIVNVSSVYGMGAAAMQGVYGMTKAAVISMTKTLATEWAPAGIRVNAISPGLVDTKLAAAIVHNPEFVKHFTDRAPLARYATPDEIAGLAVYLASDESGYCTGQTIALDGGYTIG